MKLWHYTTGVAFCGSVLLAGCGPESLAPPTFPPSQAVPPATGLQSVQSIDLVTGLELRAQDLSFDYINPTFQGGGVLARDGNSGTASGRASARLIRPGASGNIQLELLNPLNILVNAISNNDARLVGTVNFVSAGSTSESDGLGLRVGSRFDIVRSEPTNPSNILSRLSATVERISVPNPTALSPGDQVLLSGTSTALAANQSILNESTAQTAETTVRLNEGRFNGTFVVQNVQTTARGRCTVQVIPDPNSTDPNQRPASQGYSVLLSTTLVSQGMAGEDGVPSTSRSVVLRINRTRVNNTVVTATIPGTIADNGQVIFDVRDLAPGNVFPDGPVLGTDANPSVRDELFIVADPSTGCNDVTIPPITFARPPAPEERNVTCTIRPIAAGPTADSYSVVVQLVPPVPELVGRSVGIRVTRTRQSGIATSTTPETLPPVTFTSSGEAVFNIFERFRVLTITATNFTYEEQSVFPFGFLVIPNLPPVLDIGVRDEVVITSSPDNICRDANSITVPVPAPAPLPIIPPTAPQFPIGPDPFPTPFGFATPTPTPAPPAP